MTNELHIPNRGALIDKCVKKLKSVAEFDPKINMPWLRCSMASQLQCRQLFLSKIGPKSPRSWIPEAEASQLWKGDTVTPWNWGHKQASTPPGNGKQTHHTQNASMSPSSCSSCCSTFFMLQIAGLDPSRGPFYWERIKTQKGVNMESCKNHARHDNDRKSCR